MKKTVLLVSALALTLAFSAEARRGFGGGFVDANAQTNVTNVADVDNLRDETYVTLKGSISAQVGHEKYSFKDATGTIIVEIDDDDWRGVVVKPGDTVILEGEVDKHFMRPTEVEVDNVYIAQ